MLCSNDAPNERESALRARNVEVLRIPTAANHLNLHAALAALAERNILSVLIEAGSSLNGSLLRANLVDKLVLYYAERELGIDAIPFATNFDSPYALQQRLTHTTRTTFPSDLAPNAEDVRITGYLHDPWANSSTA
jgi:diaminohydroxyphosphoribosylaminopyrimidine deaminase/5-amino-6-(5-phosphoribosylamino)uracil reductase